MHPIGSINRPILTLATFRSLTSESLNLLLFYGGFILLYDMKCQIPYSNILILLFCPVAQVPARRNSFLEYMSRFNSEILFISHILTGQFSKLYQSKVGGSDVQVQEIWPRRNLKILGPPTFYDTNTFSKSKVKSYTTNL